jgi:hypothetical protein
MTETPRVQRTTVVWPESVRKALVGSVLIGYGLALAGFVIGFSGSDLSIGKALLHGLVVLAVIAVPPTVAMLGHSARPLMLLPAGVIGLLGLFGVLSILGFPLVLLGLFWLWAYLKLGSPGSWVSKTAMILAPLLWLGASAALWIHVDPACEQRLQDGTFIEVDPATRGFESGWAWEMSSSFSSSSGPISGDVVYDVCDSNVVVLWEATSAILLCAGAVLVARWLAHPSTLPTTKA